MSSPAMEEALRSIEQRWRAQGGKMDWLAMEGIMRTVLREVAAGRTAPGTALRAIDQVLGAFTRRGVELQEHRKLTAAGAVTAFDVPLTVQLTIAAKDEHEATTLGSIFGDELAVLLDQGHADRPDWMLDHSVSGPDLEAVEQTTPTRPPPLTSFGQGDYARPTWGAPR